MGNLFDEITQAWVRLTGKRFDPNNTLWLDGPIGGTKRIGDDYLETLAAENGAKVLRHTRKAGLIQSTDQLGFTNEEKKTIHPAVLDFYLNTSEYQFDFWSVWCGIFRPFGWLLQVIFSRRLQQLNLPLSPMTGAHGLESEIITIKRQNKILFTIWFRRLVATKDVIYSGVYTTCRPKPEGPTMLKVVFPLPNGNAMVIMDYTVETDGALLLESKGKSFGASGFYFTLRKKASWVRMVKSMHETIRVYVDSKGILRADHLLYFYRIKFLKLHYRMHRS